MELKLCKIPSYILSETNKKNALLAHGNYKKGPLSWPGLCVEK